MELWSAVGPSERHFSRISCLSGLETRLEVAFCLDLLGVGVRCGPNGWRTCVATVGPEACDTPHTPWPDVDRLSQVFG